MPDAHRHPLATASLAAAQRVHAVGDAVRSLALAAPRGSVVLAGAGVGAHAATAVHVLAQPDAARPVSPVGDGPLPPWVGADDLVVCLGATQVASRAAALGSSVVSVGPAIPGAMHVPVPRNGDDRFDLAPLTAAGFAVLGAAGVVPAAPEQLQAAVVQLRRRSGTLTPVPSAIDRLARRIDRRLPLVVGSGLTGVAARSWTAQVARSAKVIGLVHEFPAAVHDAVAGWGQHGDVTRQVFVAVLLRGPDEPPTIAAQLDAYHVLLEEVVAEVYRVDAEGDGPLARLLDLVLLGEQLGVAMAVREGLDPEPEPSVDEFRSIF